MITTVLLTDFHQFGYSFSGVLVYPIFAVLNSYGDKEENWYYCGKAYQS